MKLPNFNGLTTRNNHCLIKIDFTGSIHFDLDWEMNENKCISLEPIETIYVYFIRLNSATIICNLISDFIANFSHAAWQIERNQCVWISQLPNY